ncbi:hypothetical protein SMD44_08517 [Streptomyces alboflavus]|uniref:Uncharacterized protein n=1 Tax=Streptomyces alboflavus TaxID=67267 RepID=A0A1Z1WRI0_9ACTN|nr:hypothetical protein SMD44_08517 [Streptomyces alboflavus]
MLEGRAVHVEFGQVPGLGVAEVEDPAGERPRGLLGGLEDAAASEPDLRPGAPARALSWASPVTPSSNATRTFAPSATAEGIVKRRSTTRPNLRCSSG